MTNDEWELLTAFVRTRSDAAFAELTGRYARLVYGRCLRQLGDRHAAEDVTQGVFLVLAAKAAGLPADVPLAAWLYRVAGLACRNEVKMRARRRRHEAAAAADRARALAPTDDAVTALAPLLDAAVDRLGAADRQAVLMRYFDGLSVADVAAALGVAENTAGRRLLRAVEKLRRTFAAGGVTVPAAAVGAAVTAVVAATASPPAGAATPAAAVHARRAARSLRWAAWAPAAAAAAVGATVVAAVVLVATWPDPPARPLPAQLAIAPVAVVAPPAAPVDRPASAVPGLVQLCQWDVVLDDAAAAAVADAGRPVDTPSKGYHAFTGDAAALRRAVAAALAAGTVPLVSHEAQAIPLPQSEYDGKRSNPQLAAIYSADRGGRFLSVQAISQRRDDRFDRQPDGTVRLHLDHPDLNAGVADRPYTNPRRLPGGSGVVFDGDLAPGRAVWFVVRLPGRSGRVYHHLIAWEAYRVTAAEAATIAFPTDAGWWCQHGPEQVRLWADAARVWADGTGIGTGGTRLWAGSRPLGPPSLGRPVSSGETVWLTALCRPSEAPWCWWDPAGHPAATGGRVPDDAGPPAGLWADVNVYSTRPSDRPSSATADDQDWGEADEPFGLSDDRPVPGDAGHLTVGVPVGPWAEVGRLRYGQPLTAGGVRYEIAPSPDNPDYWAKLTRRGVLDDQFHLVAVQRDGTKHRFEVRRELMWGQPGLTRDLTEDAYAEGGPTKIDYFSVRTRRREFVTFDRFAARPATPLPTDPTRAAVDAAMAGIAARHLQVGLDLWRQQRLGHLLDWSSANADWNDGQRLLARAAVATDEAGVRGLLDADAPQAAAAVPQLAHLVATGEAIRTAVARRFGEPAAHDLLDRPGLFEDLQGELTGVNWSGTLGSRYHVHPYTDMESNDGWLPHVTWRQGPTGAYALDVDDLFPDAAAVARLAERCRRADDVRRRVGTASLDELRRAVAAGS